MARLFSALRVPEEVAFQLSQMRGGLIGARWIDPDRYHITLRFIGDVSSDLAGDISLALSSVRRPSFILQLDKLGVFGHAKARAIVAFLRPSDELMALQRDIENKLQRLGIPACSRKFIPHITLARLRGVDHYDLARFFDERAQIFSAPFCIDRHVLLSSRAFTGGGPYVSEAEYFLYQGHGGCGCDSLPLCGEYDVFEDVERF